MFYFYLIHDIMIAASDNHYIWSLVQAMSEDKPPKDKPPKDKPHKDMPYKDKHPKDLPPKDKPRKNKRKYISVTFSLAILVLIAYIVISFISGQGFGFGCITDMFTSTDPVEIGDEFFFNIGRRSVFADLDNAVAAVGTQGIQVHSYDGTEAHRTTLSMQNPAISAQNGRAIAFDIGGVEARIFNSYEMLSSISTSVPIVHRTDSGEAVSASGPIVSAYINQNGWFTITTQGSEGYRGLTDVYNSDGNLIFGVRISSGYILSAILSPDNKSLAVLNLTEDGSRITFYHGLNSGTPDGVYEIHNKLIIEIEYLSDGNLLAVTTDGIISINPISMTGWEFFSFSGSRLGGYEISDNFIALHLLDFGIGHRGRLLIIDLFGNLFGEIITERELVSMSFLSNFLTVMLSDGLSFYDRGLTPIPLLTQSPSAVGVSRVLALDDGIALVAGDRFAIVVR
jgi:hypothetical protein